MKKSIKIEVGDAVENAKGFIDAWRRSECGVRVKAEHRLQFENLVTLLKTLTPRQVGVVEEIAPAGSSAHTVVGQGIGQGL